MKPNSIMYRFGPEFAIALVAIAFILTAYRYGPGLVYRALYEKHVIQTVREELEEPQEVTQ